MSYRFKRSLAWLATAFETVQSYIYMSAVQSYEIGRYFLMSIIRVFIRSEEDVYYSRDVFQGASKMLLRKGLFDPTICCR